MSAKPINNRQLKSLYWPEWRAAEKVLRANHYDKAEAEEVRKEIHVAVTGRDCSSKDLTNSHLDKVLAKFRAISNPKAGAYQARQADQPAKRVRFRIHEIRDRLGLSDAYIDTVARKVAKRPLEHCDEKQLRKILAALSIHENRHAE